jgi:hypothetical protein
MATVETRVLYLGMADDIMAPLLLVPDVDTLFVIDIFDAAFSRDETLQGQRADIKQVLTQGSDDGTYARRVFTSKELAHVVHTLPGRAEIVAESDDPATATWRLSFFYQGKQRELVVFNKRNFVRQPWPEAVCDIGVVLTMGAFAWRDTRHGDLSVFVRMMATRTRPVFDYYALHFLHEYLPNQCLLKCGKERLGTKIAFATVDKQSADGLWLARLCGKVPPVMTKA